MSYLIIKNGDCPEAVFYPDKEKFQPEFCLFTLYV